MVEVALTLVGLVGGFAFAEVATWLQRRRELADTIVFKSNGIAQAIVKGTADEARWYLGELRPYIDLVRFRIPRAETQAQSLVQALDAAIDSKSLSQVDAARSAFVRAARLF
jgi:hypothetical protein